MKTTTTAILFLCLVACTYAQAPTITISLSGLNNVVVQLVNAVEALLEAGVDVVEELLNAVVSLVQGVLNNLTSSGTVETTAVTEIVDEVLEVVEILVDAVLELALSLVITALTLAETTVLAVLNIAEPLIGAVLNVVVDGVLNDLPLATIQANAVAAVNANSGRPSSLPPLSFLSLVFSLHFVSVATWTA
jgi:hypothetical protein